jgi:repressor LexA
MDEGDIVVIHKQDYFESEDICITLINGEEATIKKVVKSKNGIELHAVNPYYPPRKFTCDEIEKVPVKIIGKVVEHRRFFK